MTRDVFLTLAETAGGTDDQAPSRKHAHVPPSGNCFQLLKERFGVLECRYATQRLLS